MSKWYEEVEQKRYIRLADGPVKFKIEKIYRKMGSEYAPKRKDGTLQDWALEIVADDGRALTVSSFALQKELFDVKADVGDLIEIKRPSRGKYLVKVHGRDNPKTEEAPF
jgi:hypothetical protein